MLYPSPSFAVPPPQFVFLSYPSLVFLDSRTFPQLLGGVIQTFHIPPALAACSAASASPSMYFLLSGSLKINETVV